MTTDPKSLQSRIKRHRPSFPKNLKTKSRRRNRRHRRPRRTNTHARPPILIPIEIRHPLRTRPKAVPTPVGAILIDALGDIVVTIRLAGLRRQLVHGTGTPLQIQATAAAIDQLGGPARRHVTEEATALVRGEARIAACARGRIVAVERARRRGRLARVAELHCVPAQAERGRGCAGGRRDGAGALAGDGVDGCGGGDGAGGVGGGRLRIVAYAGTGGGEGGRVVGAGGGDVGVGERETRDGAGGCGRGRGLSACETASRLRGCRGW